ncbi:MAG: hypothetical protein LV479_08345 [Methylacidiphilales bacterium]|nr:hypothetical protein [Candidatus Methylacidiphilales bacterium]
MSAPSEPWITLQSSDLNDYLVGPQASAVRTAALAAGQGDTWANVSTSIITFIRSKIRASLRNQVSATPNTIPPDLKDTAMALIVERLQTRIPQLKLSDDQVRNANNARKYLDQIANNEAVITAPPDPLIPDDQQRGTPITVVRSNPRELSRRTLRGL